MQKLAVTLLAFLLILCPAVCGAVEIGHGEHGGTAAGETSTPNHCPEDGDDCICQGAVQADDVRVPDFDAVGFPFLFAMQVHTPLHPGANLTWSGSPTGLAGWGDVQTVRAFLQNFRF